MHKVKVGTTSLLCLTTSVLSLILPNFMIKLELVIGMSHENISVKFQKLQICPSCSVCVYLFLLCLTRLKLSVSKSACCIQSCIFKNQNKIQKNQNKIQNWGQICNQNLQPKCSRDFL